VFDLQLIPSSLILAKSDLKAIEQQRQTIAQIEWTSTLGFSLNEIL
jgi:hypothetical protein